MNFHTSLKEEKICDFSSSSSSSSSNSSSGGDNSSYG